ncbi:MAG TPA: tRNA (guanosine(46)-N7)-methyltransferase TrmB [Chthoniobacterales bacterium]|nr:tRNA (guanosine(46)-N7)-methyltransferase TrmB [Chthoniobacterales bacterium]
MIQLIPETLFAPLDLLEIFGREAPLQVDLGCGDGSFLCELAARNPDRNFLGVEKLAGRVAKSCRKSSHLGNVRILNLESTYAVRHLLPAASVETFYLFFPDPWPKRRHHRRRIVTASFLDAIASALMANGMVRIATDQLDYFRAIERLGQQHPGFAVADSNDVELPMTKFQRRFTDLGAPIYWLALRKVSPVT